jgi:hypothetical protein
MSHLAMSVAVELMPPEAFVFTASKGATGRTTPAMRACGVATLPASRVDARLTRVSSIPNFARIRVATNSSQVCPLTASITSAAA